MNNNQRDSRWSNILIADMSIGQIGCTVSALGDVLNTTPDVVVAKLKAVGGFLGNLIIWAKIPEAFPGITVNRVWAYDNAAVKNAIPNVIVEVPASAIGGTGSHWVNYIGNQQCKDPWTGTIRPTSDFPNPTGYCIISGTWTDPQVAQQSIVDGLRVERDANWNLYVAEQAKNTDLTKQIQDLQAQCQNLREAFDAQTKADANTGTQLLDAQHERDYYRDIVTGVAKDLNVDSTKRVLLDFDIETAVKALQAPHSDVVKQVQPVIDGLAAAALTTKKAPPSLFERIKNFLGL